MTVVDGQVKFVGISQRDCREIRGSWFVLLKYIKQPYFYGCFVDFDAVFDEEVLFLFLFL